MKELFTPARIRFYTWTAIAFLLIYSLAEFFTYPQTITARVINSFILLVYLTPLHFILFEYVLPLFKRKSGGFLKGVLLMLILIVVYSVGLYYWRECWILLSAYTSFHQESDAMNGILTHSRFSFVTILFFGTVRHFYNHAALVKKANRLQLEKQQAELNFLKGQTNPHFLFNTLNNIYSLAQDKSDLAPESILRLSKILRFMLYETGGKYITIGQELSVLENYIALEKLRYDESLQIKFRKQVDNEQQQVPPLLLMPFVENAFKHGVSETRSNAFVDIQLEIENNKLVFEVINSTGDQDDVEEEDQGIGLPNLRRQLQLLYKEYDITVDNSEGRFMARMNINLLSHV